MLLDIIPNGIGNMKGKYTEIIQYVVGNGKSNSTEIQNNSINLVVITATCSGHKLIGVSVAQLCRNHSSTANLR